jgi:hypothetical protein
MRAQNNERSGPSTRAPDLVTAIEARQRGDLPPTA